MLRSAHYFQDCPTCGRALHVRVEYLGRLVVCRHCRGEFQASDPANNTAASDSGIELVDRANKLLESVRVDA